MSQTHDGTAEADDDTGEHPCVRPEISDPLTFFQPEARAVEVRFGGHSHAGRVRENNEDHFMVVRRRRRRDVLLGNLPEGLFAESDEDAYVLVVADGMGGAAFGELASLLALQAGWDIGLRDVKRTLKGGDKELRELMRKVEGNYQEIDRALIQQSLGNVQLQGMGTTLTLAYTIGPEAIIAHAGDSRAYLHHSNGTLRQLTHDHTIAQELADGGVIPADQVATHRLRNVLTRCLGGPGEGIDPDILHIQLADGDGLLLCSDGLTDVVADDEIARILDAHPDPDAACRALIDLALERGGPDNVTVLLGRYAIPAELPSR